MSVEPDRVTSERAEPEAPVVEIRDVHFQYAGRMIFDHVNLHFRRGAISAVMGPSGTGKTTLLRLIMGQFAPDSGQVKLFGEDIARLNNEELYRLRRRVGLLFQSGALLTDLSVFENVAFPLR